MQFTDRVEAGRQLAARLTSYANRHDVVVLALPRGGVPVAFEVAKALGAPLDVFLVRKLGVPGHPELAMGAIAAGGVRVLSPDLIDTLGIPPALVEQVAVREHLELDRRDRLYRGGRPLPVLSGRTIILVDDGLATGSTMEAAIAALREHHPARIVVAAPVGARETCERLTTLADEVVCAQTPEPFSAVGLWYTKFDQTTDEEVIDLLNRASQRAGQRTAPAGPRGGIDAVDLVRTRALPLTDEGRDYDTLLDAISDAHVVLLGEATHGTHEFYCERAFITQRLIAEKGFAAVAVEADWPDAYRVNRYVRGAGEDQDAVGALGDFKRFPTWMWRNTDVVNFVGWLRAHNETKAPDARVGYYGLDLYSLRASMEAVLAYLSKVDPDGASRARTRYACFDQFGEDPQSYGYATEFGLTRTCEQEAISQLIDLQRRRAEYASRDGRVAPGRVLFR